MNRRQAADDFRFLQQHPAGAGRILVDGVLGRDIATTYILGKRSESDAVEIELVATT